jgi:hypothetical protein
MTKLIVLILGWFSVAVACSAGESTETIENENSRMSSPEERQKKFKEDKEKLMRYLAAREDNEEAGDEDDLWENPVQNATPVRE